MIMKIPQNKCLHSQSFNSNFIEFVWRFPSPAVKNFIHQIICKMYKDGSVYIEYGIVDNDGIFLNGEPSLSKYDKTSKYLSSCVHHGIDMCFEDGELIGLLSDVIKFLNKV